MDCSFTVDVLVTFVALTVPLKSGAGDLVVSGQWLTISL